MNPSAVSAFNYGWDTLSEEDAAELLEAEAGPRRKALIKCWLDKVGFWDGS
jgi:hypothetical protein